MVAILTKYHGPTNTRPSRFSASANGHKATAPYDYAISDEENHAKAAIALCLKMGWKGELIGGGTDDGYAFVFSDGSRHIIE